MSSAAEPFNAELVERERVVGELFAKSEITPRPPGGRDNGDRRIPRATAVGGSGDASRHSHVIERRPDSPINLQPTKIAQFGICYRIIAVSVVGRPPLMLVQ